MNRLKRLTGKKMLLTAMALCVWLCKGSDGADNAEYADIDAGQSPEIALDENPTIRWRQKKLPLKKVASREAWQSLLPEASLNGSLDHTIKAAEMKLNDMSFKMGQDGTNTANAGLSINLPFCLHRQSTGPCQ